MIIPDGNRRWAKFNGLEELEGHKKSGAYENLKNLLDEVKKLKISYFTLWGFSTENWKRPKSEVTLLMKLLIKSIRGETDRLNQNDVRLIATGDLNNLPSRVLNELNEAMEITSNNKLMTLNLALSYSGRWDILNAVKMLIKEQNEIKFDLESINEKKFSEYLVTKDIPDPDLLIRTGGEFRISNFLLWQLAYSEIYIDSHYWPDFKRNQFYKAISDYQGRERRFGLISEQLDKQTRI